MIMSLTSMDIANASLLDEATAAAEAMVMAYVQSNQKKKTFFVDKAVLPQTISVLKTRAKGFGIHLVVGDLADALKNDALRADLAGVLVQYPDVNGFVTDYSTFTKDVHAAGALVVVATDLLALTLLQPPGEWGADIVLGNSARFGVPAGYGGPHGAFFAVTEKLKRKMPGRLIGRSKDVMGNPAYRLALQSMSFLLSSASRFHQLHAAREQHIRREKATSNICTSQALLANMAAMYAVYHGPVGLERIAKKVHFFTQVLKTSLEGLGFHVINASSYFDTLTIDVSKHCANAEEMHGAAAQLGINLRRVDHNTVGVTLDESVGDEDLLRLVRAFYIAASLPKIEFDLPAPTGPAFPPQLVRESKFLQHPVFNKHHSETEMLRYIFHLASKDLGLVHAMIPLGSCTMKLNSTSSMIPLTWPEFGGIHPFAPTEQVEGYRHIIKVRDVEFVVKTGMVIIIDRNWKTTSARLPVSMRAPCSQTRVLQVNMLD